MNDKRTIRCPECREDNEVAASLLSLDTYQCVGCSYVIDLVTQRATWLLAVAGVLGLTAVLVL